MQYAHGEFIITRCGDAVLTQAYGPWNRECVNSFASEYRTLSECLHGKAWCDIVSVVGESLLIPDAEALLHESQAFEQPRRRNLNACIAIPILIIFLWIP